MSLSPDLAPAKKPRRRKPATVAEVNAMRAEGIHSVGDNLMLAVSPFGARRWIARVRDHAGKRRDIGLGPYGDISLAEAREKAREMRRASREGIPILTKAERRKAARAVPTFKEAAESVHKERKGVWKNGKHQDQWINTLKDYAYPKLGDLAVDKIGAAQVIDVLSPIWSEKPETARRVRQRIGTVIAWAHAREYRHTQLSMDAVAAGLGAQREDKGNFAALEYQRIAMLVAALRAKETVSNLALEFLILTAARSGEVRGATWAEIDLEKGEWQIPGSRMKAGKEHVVPLTDRAIQILKRMAELRSCDVVFPGNGGNPMSDMTMAKALRATAVTQEKGGKITVHGMRSAFRDWVSEETSFPGDAAEAALAHAVKSKVEAAYRRGNLLAKRREMMNAWATYCEGTAANVVRMVVG